MTSAPEAAVTRVVHVAPTPLVRAPEKLSETLNGRDDFESTSIVLKDYPGEMAGKFVGRSILWPKERLRDRSCVQARALEEADIVHVHNRLPKDVVDVVADRAHRARFVYQAHSPLREGPLYRRAERDMDLPFDRLLAVAHFHPRHYQDHTPVPNIIDFKPSCRPLGDGLPRVLYCPSHRRGGRWNGKHSDVLERALAALTDLGCIEAVVPQQRLSPFELMELRRTTHISIDEIVTGGFHQVSIEGLCAGNVVVNDCDFFASATLQIASGAGEPPPFVRTDERAVGKVLRDLAEDRQRLEALRRRSYDYFCGYLTPQRLIQPYVTIYEEIIGA